MDALLWKDATEWEGGWWGNCVNTYGEETKQLLYTRRMGLSFFHNGKSPYNIDVNGKSIVDIGSGPTSILLKCIGFTRAVAIDPIEFPVWVSIRYRFAGIEFKHQKGEDFYDGDFDEAWIYNVLQHTEDPRKVIGQARKASRLIRLFEWIDTPSNIGHIHTLTEDKLNDWLSGYGKVEQVNERNCVGKAYYGIFPTT